MMDIRICLTRDILVHSKGSTTGHILDSHLTRRTNGLKEDMCIYHMPTIWLSSITTGSWPQLPTNLTTKATVTKAISSIVANLADLVEEITQSTALDNTGHQPQATPCLLDTTLTNLLFSTNYA